VNDARVRSVVRERAMTNDGEKKEKNTRKERERMDVKASVENDGRTRKHANARTEGEKTKLLGRQGKRVSANAHAEALTEEEKAAEVERSRVKAIEAEEKRRAGERAKAEEEARARREELESRRVEYERASDARRRAREGNASPSRPDEATLKMRDSSIKKNTTVIKKLKMITEEQRAALKQELSKVNVSKYVTEAAAACAEGKMKSSDVYAAVEVISLLHQTYVDFTPPLIAALSAVVLPPKPETLLKMAEGEAENLTSPLQRRIKLRLFMELHLAGVCRDVKPVLEAVKELARLEYKTSPELFQHSLSTLSSFAKTFAVEMLGIAPEFEPRANDYILPPEVQKEFKGVLNAYCDRVFLVLVEAFNAVTAQEREMARLLERTGAISESASVEFAALTKVFDGLLKGASALTEALERELPEMKKKAEVAKVSTAGTMELHRGGVTRTVESSDLWEDDEQQHFYETLADLRASIPAVLLAEKDTTNETEAERLQREREEEAEGRSVKLEGLLMRLSDCFSKDKADAICTDFCYIAARGGRRRLTREFLRVHRSETSRLPFYGRMIATLSEVFPDIGSEVSQTLKEEFDSLARKGKRAHIEDRLKNIKFIGELVKFGMITDAVIFSVIKVLLDDFQGDNVDVLCCLFDVAGLYLTRLPTSAKRMGSILDIFLRLKAVSDLDPRQCALLDGAYFTCRPAQTVIVRKVRPPLHEYIRHLIYSQLSKNSLEKVTLQLRKLPWQETEPYLLKRLLKVCKGKYASIPLVAILISRLSKFYPMLAVRSLDAVFEDIRFGLEENAMSMHQRRVANMRLLGFLYKERIASFREILDTLYLIISIGYDGRKADDHPKDTIRLRMVCTLLETCFNARGSLNYSQRKQLDKFLLFFQRYALTKEVALDISNDVMEVMLSLKPRIKICETYEEADAECKKALDKSKGNSNGIELVPDDDDDDDDGDGDADDADGDKDDEDVDMDDDGASALDDESLADVEAMDVGKSVTTAITDDFAQDQEVKVRMKPEYATKQEERDFEREMNKFLGGTVTSGVSMLGGGRNQPKFGVKSKNVSTGTIAFKMLVKNQGKQGTRELHVPEGAEFVANVKEVMKAEEAELAEVRRRVLNSAMYDDDAPPAVPSPTFGAPRRGASNRRQQSLNITGRL